MRAAAVGDRGRRAGRERSASATGTGRCREANPLARRVRSAHRVLGQQTNRRTDVARRVASGTDNGHAVAGRSGSFDTSSQIDYD